LAQQTHLHKTVDW